MKCIETEEQHLSTNTFHNVIQPEGTLANFNWRDELCHGTSWIIWQLMSWEKNKKSHFSPVIEKKICKIEICKKEAPSHYLQLDDYSTWLNCWIDAASNWCFPWILLNEIFMPAISPNYTGTFHNFAFGGASIITHKNNHWNLISCRSLVPMLSFYWTMKHHVLYERKWWNRKLAATLAMYFWHLFAILKVFKGAIGA